MPSLLIATLLLAASPASVEWPTAECDLLEIEHVYDRDGVHLFDQVLARSWEPTGHCEIRDYRITKQPSDYPVFRDGCYVVPWGGAAQMRRVQARHLTETWHQCDSEVLERKRWPQGSRRSLFSERQPTPAPESGFDPLPPAPDEP